MNFVKLCESIIDELELVEEASKYELTRIGNDTRKAKDQLTQALRSRNVEAAIEAKEELVRQKNNLAYELRPGVYSKRTEPWTEEELDKLLLNLSSQYDFLPLTILNLGKIDQQIAEIEKEKKTLDKKTE